MLLFIFFITLFLSPTKVHENGSDSLQFVVLKSGILPSELLSEVELKNIRSKILGPQSQARQYVLTVSKNDQRNYSDFEEVDYIEPLTRYKIDALASPLPFDDPLYSDQWYLPLIGLEDIDRSLVGDSSVIVGVIDTGIFGSHEELISSIWYNFEEFENNQDSDQNGFIDDIYGYDFVDYQGITSINSDKNGHGTAMASIIAADRNNEKGIVGLAPNTKLLSVRAFDQFGFGTSLAIAQAIYYSVDAGASILNLSFGDTFESRMIHDAIKYAYQKGVICVASGGNVGGPFKRYPVAFPEVIGVSWTTERDRIAGLGSYGAHIDLGAPGSGIVHAALNSNSYGISNGSSASAALVSGATALLLSENPHLTPPEVLESLQKAAFQVRGNAPSVEIGAGRLDLRELFTTDTGNKLEIHSITRKTLSEEEYVEVDFTVIGKDIKEWTLSIAEGLREPLFYDVIENDIINSLNKSILFSPKDLFIDSDITIKLSATLYSGKTLSTQKSFLFQDSPQQLNLSYIGKVFVDNEIKVGILSETTSPGIHTWMISEEKNENVYTTNDIIASKALLISPLNYTFPSTNIIQVENVEQNWVLSSDTLFISASTLEKNNVPVTPLNWKATKWNFQNLFTFPESKIDSISDIFYDQFTDNTGNTVVRVYNDKSLLFTIPENGIPRSMEDVNNDGKGELLLQQGGQFKIFTGDEATIIPGKTTLPIMNEESGEGFGATFADLDNDGLIEVWAHRTNDWVVYEWDNSQFIQIAFVENSSLAEKGAYPLQNIFEIPNLAVVTNELGLNYGLVGDFESDILLIQSDEDNQFYMTPQLRLQGLRGGNELTTFSVDGKQFGMTVTGSWPGLTNEREVEPNIRWIYLFEIGTSGLPSIHIVDSLLVHDAVLENWDIKVNNTLIEPTIWMQTTPYLLGFVIENDKLSLRHTEKVTSSPIALGKEASNQIIVKRAEQYEKSVEEEQFVPNLSSIFKWFTLSEKKNEKDSISVHINSNFDLEKYSIIINENEFFNEKLFSNTPYDFVIDTSLLNHPWSVHIDLNGSLIKFEIEPREQFQISPTLKDIQSVGDDILFRFDHSMNSEFSRVHVVHPTTSVPISVNLRSIHPHRLQLSLPEVVSHEIEGSFLFRSKFGVPLDTVIRWTTKENRPPFYIIDATLLDVQTTQVRFSTEIDPFSVVKEHIQLFPRGIVSNVELIGENKLEISVDQTQFEGSGVVHTLEFPGITSKDGQQLTQSFSKAISIVDESSGFEEVRAYPNPWKRSEQAFIQFANVPIEAEIHIFNVQGEVVAIVRNESLVGGVSWNGILKNGKPASSGVYYYLVKREKKQSSIKKIAIIR